MASSTNANEDCSREINYGEAYTFLIRRFYSMIA